MGPDMLLLLTCSCSTALITVYVDVSSRLELRVSVVLILSSLLEKSHDPEVSCNNYCTVGTLHTLIHDVIGIACWRVAIISGPVHSPHSSSGTETSSGHWARPTLENITTGILYMCALLH